MPALMYDPRSKGAESYIRLAKEILDRPLGVGLPAPGELLEPLTPATGSQVPAEQSLTTASTEGTEQAAAEGQGSVEEMPKPAEEMDKTA